MNLRLGVYECPSCGHEIEPPPPMPEPEPERHGPGFRREAWHQPASRPAGQPPPPPAPGTVFAPGAAPAPGSHSRPQPGYDAHPGLYTEKVVFLTIQAVGWLMMCIGFASLQSMIGHMPSDVRGMMGPMVAGLIIGGLISLGLHWFVLFSDLVWAKYCCGGCVVVGMLFWLPAMFMAPPTTPYGMPGAGGYQIISGVVGLIMYLWLLSILWRDAQRLQGGI